MSSTILCDLCDISSLQLFISMSVKYFQFKALKAMEILTGGQVRGPGKI